MRIRVEHAPLAESIAAIADSARQIRDLLDALDTDVSELKELWSGHAKESYARAQREWTRCADDMQAGLTSAAIAAARAQARTRETEARVATLWA